MRLNGRIRALCSAPRGCSSDLLNFVEIPSVCSLDHRAPPTTLILHGLLGSLSNFRRIAQHPLVSKDRRILCGDLRNHGASPHFPSMSFSEMADDVIRVLDHLQVEKAAVVGHSLGGKVAMATALCHPNRISGIAVADIAPIDYLKTNGRGWNFIRSIVSAIQQVDLNSIQSRKDADAMLQISIPDLAVRQFVLQNLVMEQGTNKWLWRMNLSVLADNLDTFARFEPFDADDPGKKFNGEALFVYGGKSDYVKPEYMETIQGFFPSASYSEIPGTGHWLHAQKPMEFITVLGEFLKKFDH